MKLEEAQQILKHAGIRVRVKLIRTNLYVIKCPDKQCPHHKLSGAFKDVQLNKVILNAARHFKSAAARKDLAKRVKERQKLLFGGENGK